MNTNSGPTIQPRRWWTKDEDQILRQEAELQLNAGSLNDWSRIAQKLPKRSNKDCRKRWSKICEHINKGAWSDSEDQRLREAIAHFGTRWTHVAQFVQTRHGDQCAKRWQQSLDPLLDHSEWRMEEDKSLIAAVSANGRSWKSIGERDLPGRSVTDIKNRYTVLERRKKQAFGTPSMQITQPPFDRVMTISPSSNVKLESSESMGSLTDDELTEDDSGAVFSNFSTQTALPSPAATSFLPFAGTGTADMANQHMDFTYPPAMASSNQELNSSSPMPMDDEQSLGFSSGADGDASQASPLYANRPTSSKRKAWESPLSKGQEDLRLCPQGASDLLDGRKSTLVLEDVEPDMVRRVLDALRTTKNNVKIRLFTQQE